MKDNKPKLTDFTPNTLQVDLEGRRAYWYFGVVVYVPKRVKWLAMDNGGDVFGYAKKPVKDFSEFSLSSTTEPIPNLVADFVNVTSPDWIADNWFNSRIKVKDLKRFRCFAP